MFENFSDGARRALALANQHANRLVHNYIAPEHILLGVIDEEGRGWAVLRRLSANHSTIRLNTENALKPGMTKASDTKVSHAKQAIQCAIEECGMDGSSEVGTDHLLLGLLHSSESIAGSVLQNLGITLEHARMEARNLRSNDPVEYPLPRPTRLAISFAKIDRTRFTPEMLALMETTDRLAIEKQATVRNADFNRAAALRDEIARLQAKLVQRNGSDDKSA